MDTLEIAAKMVRDAVGAMSTKFSELVKSGLDDKQDIATMPTKVSDFTNDSNFQNAQQVEDKIDAKISSAYKAGGSATLAALPALTAAKLGVVVNMSEDFTTTSDFLEGVGKTYPAGTNVVVALAGANTYKYDVLAGFVDLSRYVMDTRKVGNVPLSADIPVNLTGDSTITATNTGTASAIGYSVTHANSGVTAGSKGDASAQTPGFGGMFKALSATVDAKGHVTALGEHNVTIPSATATSQANGLMSSSDKAKLDALSVTASNPLEVTKTGETYNVTLKDSGVTAGSKGDASAQTPGFGGMFKALSATVDAKGRLTALLEHNVTVPNATATQSAAGLMSAADKAKLDGIANQANKTTIDATLSNTGQAADAKAAGDAFAALRDYIASMEVYRTASGNPATFNDGAAANLKEITVTITPTQSGSGDPSPSNVRPISGVSSVTVTRTGTGGANSQSVTVSLVDSNNNPLTVYGGTLDVTAGTLTVTRKSVVIGRSAALNSGSAGGNWEVYVSLSDKAFGATNFLCDEFAVNTSHGVYAIRGRDNSSNLYVILPVASFNAALDWLDANPAQVVYPLATPLTYNLTAAQLAALVGYNSVSADAGSVSVTYRADTSITFGGAA